MKLVNEVELHFFARRHPLSRKPLNKWIKFVKLATWTSFSEVRLLFGTADYVKGQVVFNIGANNYRVITSIDYSAQIVFVLEVLTHAQYDRWKA